jgi:hypothetical protein
VTSSRYQNRADAAFVTNLLKSASSSIITSSLRELETTKQIARKDGRLKAKSKTQYDLELSSPKPAHKTFMKLR